MRFRQFPNTIFGREGDPAPSDPAPEDKNGSLPKDTPAPEDKGGDKDRPKTPSDPAPGPEAALQAQIAELRNQLKIFEGIDPETARKHAADAARAEEERREAEKKALEERGEFDRLKGMMAEEHERKVADLNSAIEALKQEIASRDGVITELTIGAAFSASRFINDELVLPPAKARTSYESHFDIKDGAIVAYDKPRGATERTPLVDAAGKPLGFEAAIARIVENDADRDRLIKSKLAPGSSSKQDDPGSKLPASGEMKGVGRIQAALAARKTK